MYLSNIEVLGYRVFGGNLKDITSFNKLIINTLNGHSYNVAKKDNLFRQALMDSDILLPDGEAVVLGSMMLNGEKIKKIAGYDIYLHLLTELNAKRGSCFFLGAQPKTLELIDRRLHKDFYNVLVGAYSPPFAHEFSEKESEIMCKVVNLFKPDILFVGMTAPKQEKWVHQYKNKINANIICSIGAVFDFYARTKERPPEWMIKCKLEWFGRFLSEPRRMFYRYFISTPAIFMDVFFEKMHHIQKRQKTKINYSEIGTEADLDHNHQYKIAEKSLSKSKQRKKKEKQSIEE